MKKSVKILKNNFCFPSLRTQRLITKTLNFTFPKNWDRNSPPPENTLNSLFLSQKNLDEKITKNFKNNFLDIEKKYYADILNSDLGKLTYIIINDQFSKNIFRNLKKSFENDKNCLEISKKIILEKKEENFKIFERVFLGMPFMHSENLEDQDLGVEFYEKILNDCEFKTDIEEFVYYAKEHRSVIKKFGRFPHRNKILGRKGSREEYQFMLDQPLWMEKKY